MTCVEAMACGCAVIATKAASGPELIQNGVSGLLVDPVDRHEFAAEILQLLDKRELAREFGQNARERVLALFDKQKTSQENLAMYRRITGCS